MDLLANLNVVIGIVSGLVAIGIAVGGAAKYLFNKAASFQQKQTVQNPPLGKQSSYKVGSSPLSKLDWLQVLWEGLEDSIKSRGGTGWIDSLGVAIIGGIGIGMVISASNNNVIAIIVFIIFIVLWIFANLLFYTYFVGRRIEKKIEEKNRRP